MALIWSALLHALSLPARLRAYLGRLPQWIVARVRGRSLRDLDGLINAVAVVVASVMMVGLFLAHVKIVTQPGPQEFNEPAIWHVTWLLDHGRNPFSAAELPSAAYCFSPLYNYLVIALSPVVGLDYAAHRMVALVFLLLSMGLIGSAMRRAGSNLGIALLSVVFFYWMGLQNIEISARPDTLGLFFFLLGLFIPWSRGYTVGSSVVGLLCAVIAFNTKSYFVVAGCATLLVHFLARDRREACWLGVFFFALVGLTFGLTCLKFPYFYIMSIVVQSNGAEVNSRDDISTMHTIMMFERGWPYFLALVCGVGAWIWRRQHAGKTAPAPGGPITPARHEELVVMTLGAVLMIFMTVIYFYMGRNAGALFTYHLHLLFPLMFLLTAFAMRQRWLRMTFGVLLTAFFLNIVHIPEVSDSSVPYRRMEELVRSTPGEILGIACMTDIFERNGRPVLHNGNTMFVGFAFAHEGALRNPKIGLLAEKFNALERSVAAKVEARDYAIVFTEFDEPYFCSADLLRKYYDKVEQIDYFTYFGHSPVRVWVPKPK